MLVETMVEAAERPPHPGQQRRILVVDEDAAIADPRPVGAPARGDEQPGAMRDRDVGPPAPGRDADRPGEVVEAEDGAAPVRARDHQRPRDAGRWTVDHLPDIGLPLAGDAAHVEPALADQPVDDRVAADRPGDDPDRPRRAAADPGEIGAHVRGGAQHAGIVAGIGEEGGGTAAHDQGERAMARADRRRRSAGECRRGDQAEQGGEPAQAEPHAGLTAVAAKASAMLWCSFLGWSLAS